MSTKQIFFIVLISLLAGPLLSQAPSTWTVNSAAYQYQMSMTCKANVACVELADTNNYIAAFVGTQCRGVAKTKIAFGSSKLGLLTIKSNVINGEKVKFRIYRATSSTDYAVLDSVIFNHGTQTGVLASPFVLFSNHVPTDIALSATTIIENSLISTVIASLTAFDQDAGSTFNYSLTTNQPENTQFSISGDQLRVNTNYDFETDFTKIIEIHVDDKGGCSYLETFTITILDGNDTATVLSLSKPFISDHQQSGSFMGEFTSTDPDALDSHSYTLVQGPGDIDNAQFYIQNDTLYNVSELDYTAQSVYNIRARTTDLGGLFLETTFTLIVSNINDAPTDILISNFRLDENQPVPAAIGTLTVVDNDLADTHTLTVEGGLDSAAVSLSGNVLQTNSSYNFEQKDTLYVKVRATDPFTAYYIKTFTIIVNDINDVPSDIFISKDSIQELSALNSLVGNFTSTDEDAGASHTYALSTGDGDKDNGLFVISGDQLLSSVSYIYSAQKYSVRITSTDNGGLTVDKVFLIKIFNRNERPLDITLDTTTVTEDNGTFFHVSKIKSVDRDKPDSFRYALVFGAGDEDNREFEIQNDNLIIVGKTNYDVKDVYHIRLESTDLEGLSFEKAIQITVSDISGNTIPLPSTNYISPNGDGKNEFWKIENVDIYKEFKLQVFDQFGQVIFEKASEYNNEFDGRFKGQVLPTGNYYYIFKNDRISYKGNITIVN